MKKEWMNPQSDKYYKGFRYEKDKYGDDCWYDENNLRRKRITYWDNGSKYYEGYYNQKLEWHNEDGYAYQSWIKNGEILNQSYYLNGKELTEQEWKEKTGRIKSPKPDYLNPNSPKYYKGYRYHKDEECDEFWYDNGKCRKRIFYHDNGNKYYEAYYNENGEFHNEEGYAQQEWDINGKLINQEYWLNGENLTEQEWKEKTGKIEVSQPDLLICNCNSCEHQIIIRYDEEDKLYYCNIHLTNRSFIKRLISGIKYIFGYKCKYGNWDEFIFSPKHADKLIEIVNKLKN